MLVGRNVWTVTRVWLQMICSAEIVSRTGRPAVDSGWLAGEIWDIVLLGIVDEASDVSVRSIKRAN